MVSTKTFQSIICYIYGIYYIPCSSMNSLARVLFMYIKSQVMNLFMARKNMFISKFNFISMKKQNSLLFLNRLKLLTIIECWKFETHLKCDSFHVQYTIYIQCMRQYTVEKVYFQVFHSECDNNFKIKE